jgi:CIC family chloride channel protein
LRLYHWFIEIATALPPKLSIRPVRSALLAWYAPQLVGGGDAITQQTLVNAGASSAIAVIFAIRFALGPLSYAAGTPGGLFAPMLVLGAQIGVVFGRLCVQWFPDAAAPPAAYAVVGTTAFFTAVVRAPVVSATAVAGRDLS